MTAKRQSATHLVTAEDAAKAALALRGIVTRTPLLENPDVNKAIGGRLLIKAECAQRTGAFKIRDAYNCIRQLSDAERSRGVITYSSGNHAQGVALAAQLLGTSALIVMPSDVPPGKMEATRALGAETTTFERDGENSDEVVARLANQTGRIVVPPSADHRVLAGSGTVALELHEQAQDLSADPDAVLVPCGGGGLTASTAVVMHALSPKTRVYAVEPELFDDTRRSLMAREPVPNPKGRRTICDAIMTPVPNDVTFPINLDLLSGGLVASDDEVRQAMRFAYEHYKIVVEPGAAVGIAAALNGTIDIKDKVVATIVTGGNIDPARFCTLVNSETKQ
ncbi:MAG: threonine/serine dehydratase [Rhizobiales bacterium]|nr:threonine/serine dehydratase [Hyphomicrobiales bacterium]